MRPTVLALLILLAALQGCAAVIPGLGEGITVAQYANSAYSGYSLTNEYYPRTRLDADPRADLQLEETVRSRLHEDPRTHYSRVQPLCYGGDIYLLGSVASEEERQLITRAAASAPGVKSVTRCLLPQGAGVCSPARQAAQADAVKARLAGLSGVRPQRLRVESVGCNVVVLAYVSSESDRERIREALRHTGGAAPVTLYLTLLAADNGRLAAR